jgi:hypothetical protein
MRNTQEITKRHLIISDIKERINSRNSMFAIGAHRRIIVNVLLVLVLCETESPLFTSEPKLIPPSKANKTLMQ